MQNYNEARIPKQAASISPASLRSEASPLGKRQEEVLPMAKLEQRRYKKYYDYCVIGRILAEDVEMSLYD
ncbi:MAG: hypothetical protein ILA30_06155 [Selenomonas sp.]|nr:hypothetical protein [Selenomonas sp.]